jgi:membrane protease YdiL (CAAX protease family)
MLKHTLQKANYRVLSKAQFSLIGLTVFAIGFMVTLGARLYLSFSPPQQPSQLEATSAVVEVALKVSLVVIPVIFIRLFHREPLSRFGVTLGRTPLRHVVIGALTALIWLVLSYMASALIFGLEVISPRTWAEMQGFAWLFGFVHLLTLNSIGEEIESRGYLQTVFSRATGWRGGIIISATLFGVSHIPINLFIYHSNAATTLSNVVGATIFGIATGYLFTITGNILASISLHSVLNVIQFSFPLQIGVLDGAPFAKYALMEAANIIIFFIILALLTLLHRRKPRWLMKGEAT